jgi:FtsZ-interacting cell division protein YlmF
MNKYRTMINDLPELDEYDVPTYSSVRKHQHVPPQQDYQEPQYYSHPPQQQYQAPPPQQQYQAPPPQQQYQESPFSRIAPEDIPCASIAKHVESCPICSRYYQQDVSQYIIIIIALLIFNIYLLRKLLN